MKRVVFEAAPYAVLLLLAVAASLRQDLWLDEANALRILALNPTDILEALRYDPSPPLWYMFLHGFSSLTGLDGASLRSLSIVFALLFVLVLSRLAERLGPGLGTLAAWLAALNPMLLWYASELRMYTLGLFLAAILLWLALSSQLTPRRFHLAAAASTLALCTHYYLAFLVLPLGLLILSRNPRFLAHAAPWMLAWAGLLWGWYPTMQSQLDDGNYLLGPLSDYLQFEPFAALRDTLYYYCLGLGSRFPAWARVATALLCLGILGTALSRARRRALLPSSLLGLYLGLPFLLSFVRPIYHAKRYTLFGLPLLLLLLALGLGSVRKPLLQKGLIAAVLGIFLTASIIQTFAFTKSLAHNIAGALHESGADLAVFVPFYHYLPVRRHSALPMNEQDESLATLLAAHAPERLAVLPNSAEAWTTWVRANALTDRPWQRLEVTRDQAVQAIYLVDLEEGTFPPRTTQK